MKTPGQIAFEAYSKINPCWTGVDWEQLFPNGLLAWEAAAHAVLASRWISVDDRLPGDHSAVLVVANGVVQEVCMYRINGAWYWNDCGSDTEVDDTDWPSLWQPMPEPPKEAA